MDGLPTVALDSLCADCAEHVVDDVRLETDRGVVLSAIARYDCSFALSVWAVRLIVSGRSAGYRFAASDRGGRCEISELMRMTRLLPRLRGSPQAPMRGSFAPLNVFAGVAVTRKNLP